MPTTLKIRRTTGNAAPVSLSFGEWAFSDNGNARPKRFFIGQNDESPHEFAFDDLAIAAASSTVTLGSDITLSGLATPTASGQAAEYQWVLDQIQAGIDGRTWKNPVVAAELDININIANPGTATIGGVALTTGERVALGGQTNATENGIYIFDSSSTPLIRATDHDEVNEISNSAVIVDDGTNANRQLVFDIDGTETLGTDNITVVVIGSGFQLFPGDGIVFSGGDEVTIDPDGVLGFDGGITPNKKLILNSSGTANQILLSSGTVTSSPTYGALPLGDANSITGTLPIANGGTSATGIQGARNNLGIGIDNVIGDNDNVMGYTANFAQLRDAADGLSLKTGNVALDVGDVLVYSGTTWEAAHEIDGGTF